MSRDWESQFREWASPPGKTEEARCENAASAIRNAIESSEKLSALGVKVFPQGSYRNNTNVRKNSDVDIGILHSKTFFYDLPKGKTCDDYNLTTATYHFDEFKNDVEAALVDYLGESAVTRGDKAFDVHETSYHVDADVVPLFGYRLYKSDGDVVKGVKLIPDSSKTGIVNWPEQHYSNGVSKNNNTGTRYKSIVRVLKSLSNEMTAAKIQDGNIPSFLIECLVWNTPNDCFQNDEYKKDVQYCLGYLFENTETDEACKNWQEINGLKTLFQPSQKWTREQANDFIVAAWNYAKLSE